MQKKNHLKINYYVQKMGGGLGLNGIKLKWIIGTHGNWKNQNPSSNFKYQSQPKFAYCISTQANYVLELPARQHCQSTQFTSKIKQIGCAV